LSVAHDDDNLECQDKDTTPKPPPEPPPIKQPNSKTITTQWLTATGDGVGLKRLEAHRENNLSTPDIYRENCIPAHDLNSQPDEEPDGIEEGNQTTNPKAPSTPWTPPIIVLFLRSMTVATIATRIWELSKDITVPIPIGRREYKAGQCEYGIAFGESIGIVESPSGRL
jgi:hypothetical protein